MRVRQRRLWRGIRRSAPAAIETLLLAFAHGRLIVRFAPLRGLLPAVVLPTAERTPQIPPTGVLRIREKANPTLRTVSDAALKFGMGLQDRVQRRLILPDKRPGAVVLVPILAKREKLLDGYGKKARLSVIISIVLHTPSSYLLDANASRGRARIFSAHRVTIRNDRPHQRSVAHGSPRLPCLRHRRDFTTRQSQIHYLKEGTILLSK